MPESTPPRPENRPNPEEARRPERRDDEGRPRRPDEPRRVTPTEELRRFADRLERSPGANELKELMVQWLEQNIGADAAADFGRRLREGPLPTVGQLMEGVAETVLAKEPALLRRFQEKEVTLPQIMEGAMDRLFADALAQNQGADRATQRAAVERALKTYREAAGR